MFKRTWPVAGGGYHRLFPWSVISRAVSSRVRRGKPFVAYCHPYEFDPYEFRSLDLPIPLHTRLHQGLGRKGFQEKFERLLAQFDTATASEIGMAIQSRRSEPSRVCLNE